MPSTPMALGPSEMGQNPRTFPSRGLANVTSKRTVQDRQAPWHDRDANANRRPTQWQYRRMDRIRGLPAVRSEQAFPSARLIDRIRD